MKLTFPGPTFTTVLYLLVVFSLRSNLLVTPPHPPPAQLQLGTAGHLGPWLTEGYAGKSQLAKTKCDFSDGIGSATIKLCTSFSKDALWLMLEYYWLKHPLNAETMEISNPDLQKLSAHKIAQIANDDGIRPLRIHRFHKEETHNLHQTFPTPQGLSRAGEGAAGLSTAPPWCRTGGTVKHSMAIHMLWVSGVSQKTVEQGATVGWV